MSEQIAQQLPSLFRGEAIGGSQADPVQEGGLFLNEERRIYVFLDAKRGRQILPPEWLDGDSWIFTRHSPDLSAGSGMEAAPSATSCQGWPVPAWRSDALLGWAINRFAQTLWTACSAAAARNWLPDTLYNL